MKKDSWHHVNKSFSERANTEHTLERQVLRERWVQFLPGRLVTKHKCALLLDFWYHVDFETCLEKMFNSSAYAYFCLRSTTR